MNIWNDNDCYKNNWIISDSTQWSLNPIPLDNISCRVFGISVNGNLGSYDTRNRIAVRPVGYLKSTTKIVENSNDNYGSKENPFIIY